MNCYFMTAEMLFSYEALVNQGEILNYGNSLESNLRIFMPFSFRLSNEKKYFQLDFLGVLETKSDISNQVKIKPFVSWGDRSN